MNTPNNTQHRCHCNDHTTPRDQRGERHRRRDFAQRDFAPDRRPRGDFGERDLGPRGFDRDFGPRSFDRGYGRRGFDRRDPSADFSPRDFGRRGYGRRRDFDPRSTSRDFGPRGHGRRDFDPRDPEFAPDRAFARRSARRNSDWQATGSGPDRRRGDFTGRDSSPRGPRRPGFDRHTAPGDPTPENRTTRDALTGAERAPRKLTHTYLKAVSTPDPTRRDQARAILAAARRDLRTILTPEA